MKIARVLSSRISKNIAIAMYRHCVFIQLLHLFSGVTEALSASVLTGSKPATTNPAYNPNSKKQMYNSKKQLLPTNLIQIHWISQLLGL